MAGLLLDFPHRRREGPLSPELVDVYECDAGAPPSPAADPRRVRFAALSTLTITEPTDNATWYSKRERERHKLTLMRDARRAAATLPALAAMPPAARDPAAVCRCLGLEKFVSHEAYRVAQRRRADHVRAVLAAQARQRARCLRDDEELSRLSRKSSARSRRSALENAAGFWAVK